MVGEVAGVVVIHRLFKRKQYRVYNRDGILSPYKKTFANCLFITPNNNYPRIICRIADLTYYGQGGYGVGEGVESQIYPLPFGGLVAGLATKRRCVYSKDQFTSAQLSHEIFFDIISTFCSVQP